MDSPLVSVLITAYNAEPWLADTLASVAAQTYPNIEVIVVDDGSTDATLAVAQAFKHPNAAVLTQPNAGACAARNRALEASSGDLVQYLDADDLLAPDKIALQVGRLGREPGGTIASAPWMRFTGDGPDPDRPPPLKDWRDYAHAADWLVEAWATGGMFASFAWLTPRTLLDAAGPWKESVRRNQDGEYFARVLLQAERIAFVPDAWGFYRSGLDASVSRRRGADVLTSLYEVTEMCDGYLDGYTGTGDVRRARAAMWEGLAFEAYPAAPAISRAAEARAEALGGAGLKPGGGRAFRLIRDTLGWKLAVRFQSLWYAFRYGR